MFENLWNSLNILYQRILVQAYVILISFSTNHRCEISFQYKNKSKWENITQKDWGEKLNIVLPINQPDIKLLCLKIQPQKFHWY